MPDKRAMPGGVASIRRFSAAASIIRYLVDILVWLARYLAHRRVARDRLFAFLQLRIDSRGNPSPRAAQTLCVLEKQMQTASRRVVYTSD